MATETIIDKVEACGQYKIIQVRSVTITTENGVEISRAYHRHTVTPDISKTDLANESQEVQNLAASVHTDVIKTAYAEMLAEPK
jgi:hypothetical protein